MFSMFMTLAFSLLPEAGIILLWEFYDPNWVNFDHFVCQIDPYSGLKIDPEFQVKYVNPVCVRGILTRIRITI